MTYPYFLTQRPETGNDASVAIIIPVYNHARTIGRIIEDCRRISPHVIVVNDGSTDSTPAVIKRFENLHVIHHSRNQGKGAALLSGFRVALGLASWAVTIDADGQHDPREIQRLLAARRCHERNLIIGRRHGMNSPTVPWGSRIGRQFSNLWVRLSGGPELSDSQSGLRLYPLPETLALPTCARRFEYELEVLIQAHRRGLRVIEVPVAVTYPPASQRISHFHPFWDFMRNSRLFTRMLFQRLCAALQPNRHHARSRP